jgi:hypothetical protein
MFNSTKLRCHVRRVSSIRAGVQVRQVLLAVAVAATACEGLAQAQQPPGDHRVDLAARLGYGVPFGDVGGANGPLGDFYSGHVPLILEVGFRATPALTLGLYGQLGFATVKDGATTGCGRAGITCSGSVNRLGLEALYRFDASVKLMPWIGAGFGYEWLDIDSSSAVGDGSVGAKGPEFLNLQLGGDLVLTRVVAIGPFVSLTFARSETATASSGGTSIDTDISDKRFHEWLQLGVRGAFAL